jgi:DNA-binding NtrC family response regulator
MAVAGAKGERVESSDLPDFGSDRIDFRATREQFEKVYILELLKALDFQIDRTCQMTRMDRKTLLSKIDQYGISLTPTSPP